MADDASDRIKVRHKSTLAETDVARAAFEAGFFPEHEHIDSQGRPVRAAKATTEKGN